jgi:hypothetical protein
VGNVAGRRGMGGHWAGSRQHPHGFPAPQLLSNVGTAPMVLALVLLAAAGGLVSQASAGPVDSLPGLAVAACALVIYVVLRLLIVNPIRRLRDDLEPATVHRRRLVRWSGIREVAWVAQSTAGLRPATRAGARGSVVLCAVGLLSIGVLSLAAASVGSARDSRPEVLAAQAHDTIGLASAGVLHELEGAHATLVGHAANSTEAADHGMIVANLLAARPAFRAVAVLDRAGRTVASRGDGRARFAAVPPAGISMLAGTGTGPEPILVAAAPLDANYTVVGEYDVRALNDPLKAAGLPVVIVDRDFRTVLSSVGYRAFSRLTNPAWREAATNAGSAAAISLPAERTPGSVISAQQFAPHDSLATLGWTVVGERNLAEAKFAQSASSRTAVVISAFAAALVVIIVCWLYVVAVRPFARIGLYAEAVAAVEAGGEVPEPVAVELLNEVGAIAALLNRRMADAGRRQAERAAGTDDSMAPPEVVPIDPPTDVLPVVVALPRQRTHSAAPFGDAGRGPTRRSATVGQREAIGVRA